MVGRHCLGEVRLERSAAFQLGGKRRKEGVHRESHSASQAGRLAEREALLGKNLAGMIIIRSNNVSTN